MKAEELLADKKMTRKALAELVEGRWTINREHLEKFEEAAKKLSEAIGDQPEGYSNRPSFKRHQFDEAITRACELLAERQRIDHLMMEVEGLKNVIQQRDREAYQLTRERDTAQEAAASVGAAFNDFRKGYITIVVKPDLRSSGDF